MNEYISSFTEKIVITPNNPCPISFEEFIKYIKDNSIKFNVYIEYISNNGYKNILQLIPSKDFDQCVLFVQNQAFKGTLDIKNKIIDLTIFNNIRYIQPIKNISINDCLEQCFSTNKLDDVNHPETKVRKNLIERYILVEEKINEFFNIFDHLHVDIFIKDDLNIIQFPIFVNETTPEPILYMKLKDFKNNELSEYINRLRTFELFYNKFFDMINYSVKTKSIKISPSYESDTILIITFSFEKNITKLFDEEWKNF